MSSGCVVCGAEKHPQAYACARCEKILDRVETRRDADGVLRRFDRDARIRALQESWRDGAFHCFYTGVELVTESARWRDHRYLAFEPRTPSDESSVVVTSALVNRMKTDMSEAQFREMVVALARKFAGEDFDERAFPESSVVS